MLQVEMRPNGIRQGGAQRPVALEEDCWPDLGLVCPRARVPQPAQPLAVRSVPRGCCGGCGCRNGRGGRLVVNVTPGTVPAGIGVPPGVGVPVVINGVVYDRVPVRVLFTTGPRYTERSGVRVGRGSAIPAWVETAPMRNVSIRRLRPRRFYGYFVSPYNKAVVIEPGSRRVARVIGRAG